MDQNRKPVFFTSDLHIGHKNCIGFDSRPFRDLEHMHKVLTNNYNAIVPENGVCYFLGDVGMTNIEILKEFIGKLNGTKVCILGNHDGNVNRMYNIGFDVVLYSATLYIAGERVTLSHCPLRGVFREDTSKMRNSEEGENWHGEFRHTKFSVENEGQYHLHGHLHSDKEGMKSGKQWDISVVGNDYRPVSLSAVESWISRYKMNEVKNEKK